MAIQTSCSNDICVVTGNELKLFIDSCTNLISVKDSNGNVQTLDNFIVDEGITRVIAGECLTGGGTSSTVTLNHACTSTLSGTYGQPLLQDGCYIKSITVDEFGHLTEVTTDNFNTQYLGINACAVDSALLNNQAGSYYLDFCNFTNVPDLGDICGVCAGDGLGGGGDTGVVTLCNTDKGSSQNIIKNICGNLGGYTSSTNNDLFCIKGVGTVSTSITGNTLTISSSNTVNDSLITLSTSSGVGGGGSFTLNQTGSCTISFSNTDKGSDQSIFKNFCVSGEGTVTANNNNDTLSFIKGTGIDLTTNPTNQTITISSTISSANNCQIQITGGDGLSGSATFTLNQNSNGSFTITNSDKGSSQTFFQSIEVIGSCTVTADQNNDTLCLSAGTGITLTSDNTQDLITIGTTATSCTGTVTSVGATTGTTGTDFNISGSPVTTNGTITFNLPSASATNRGALTSADWSTFNSKTSCVGTVTSVGVTTGETGTDVSVSGSPITTSGVITLNIPIASATNTGKLSSTDWSDFNNKVDDVTAGTGISVSGTDTIEVTNTDLGSSQCIFKNIAVSGQNTIVADTNNDTLTFAGSGITIETDDTTDTVTFTVTDAGGTVTSVGLDTGTTGTDINVSGSPVTTSGNITLNIPDASASSRGALTSADFNTFSNKTSCVGTVFSVGATGGEGIVVTNSPITTSGSFGISVCLNELTTSIDNGDGCFFAVVDASGVQNKLTKSNINISGFNNDENFTTCTGTVSSVAVSGGTGISVSGSPITGSGTITVTNSDRGSSQCIFKNVAVSGQTTIVADSNNDTLTLANGSNISITTNATSDTVTISTSATTCTGTITGVTAGTGLSGGGTSGSVTLTNADKGSDQNIFKTICVSGQNDIVADSNNDILTFVAGTGITITTDDTTDTITINSPDAGGTVTEVCATTGTTGTDFNVSGSPITTSGTLTFNLPTASATNTGKLSSTDWSTFNSKTDCTGTVTSVSGGTGLTGTVTTSGSISVDYSGADNIIDSATDCTTIAVAGGDRIMTTNNSTSIVEFHKVSDLPFTSCTGSVTSVGATTGTSGTDFNISGSPITGSGTITFNLPTASAINTGKLSSTDWSTFNSKTTCTGTVTSVAVTGGVGIDVSGSPITGSGTIDLTIDLNELTTSTSDADGDFFAVVDSLGNQNKITKACVNLSGFNNNCGWTDCVGTITGVTASTGLSGGGSSGSVTLTNTDRGSSQNIFKNVAVSGQSTIVADSNNDTLTLVGSGLSITTDATTDTVTFTVTDAGGTVTEVCGAVGTSGTDFNVSGSPITTNGTLTFNLPVASATNTGKLSNTDWSTFNSKTTCVGTITGVTAGAGMSGGGTSGNVTLTNADRGSSQNIFKNVAVSGQSTIVADNNNDTLTLANGSNITITTNATTDTVTISSSATTCTGTVTGTGTANILPKWSSTTALTNSCIGDDGTLVCINANLRTGATDNVSTGGLSFAGGEISCATGCQSIAYGFCNNSSGGASATFGAINTTSGANSMIGGGANNCISGLESFIGGGNSNNVSGWYSSAFGLGNVGFGGGTLTSGSNNTNNGENSIIHSLNSATVNAACRSAIIGGIGNTAWAKESFISGFANQVSTNAFGGNVIFGGANVICHGHNSAVFGGSNCVILQCAGSSSCNGYATILGKCNRTCGNAYYSLTGGELSTNFSCAGISFGCGATASTGIAQFSFGRGTANPNNGTTANIEGSFVVGRYNVESTTACHLFAVGTGTSDSSRYTTLNVDANCRVGIRTLTPTTELQVVGTTTTTTLVETSAFRFKENISPIDSQIEIIKQLRPVEFDWKDTKKHDFGLIAEEVENLLPTFVEHDDDGELIGVKYSKLTAILIKGMQEQQKEIEYLKKELQILKNN